MRPFVLSVVLSVCLSVACRAVAQVPCQPYRLPIAFVAEDGSFLQTPELSGITVRSKSVVLSPLSLEADTRSKRIVILLDVSRSMAGEPGFSSWSVVTEFLQHLASVTAPNAQFALVLFADQILETTSFSEDRDAVHRRVEAISRDPEFRKQNVHGRTALFDAIAKALQLLGDPTSADSLFVVTDGGDNSSKTQPGDLAKRLSASSTRVFSILFAPAHVTRQMTPEEISAAKDYLDFVQKTGGDVFGPIVVSRSRQIQFADVSRGSGPISQQLLEFYKEMLGNALLTIQPAATFPKPATIEVTLSRSAQEKSKGARLLYPHQIAPCLKVGSHPDKVSRPRGDRTGISGGLLHLAGPSLWSQSISGRTPPAAARSSPILSTGTGFSGNQTRTLLGSRELPPDIVP